MEAQKGRLKPLLENRGRMNMDNIGVALADGRNLALRRPIDRVLVNAPCSGLGVLAKRADARWRKTEASIRQVALLQAELIRAGAELVRPGGVLVYSVCSIEPDEGRRIIDRFLADNETFELEDAVGWLSADVVTAGALATLPHRHKMDGVFAARLRRKG